MKRVLAILGICLALGVLTPAAMGVEPYSDAPVNTGITGTTATFTSPDTFPPGATVTIIVNGQAIGTRTADANGQLTFELTGLECGTTYTVQTEYAGVISTPTTVTTDPCTAGIPFTGSTTDLGRNIVLGAGLAAFGGMIVLFARRRRNAHAA